MSKRKLTHFEQTLQAHLSTIPERKYDLWQYTEDGQIVGFYYLSVAGAFQEQSYPGWRYVVERQGKTENVSENSIKIVDLHEESITPTDRLSTTAPTLCNLPLPRFCLNQQVKTTAQERGIVSGFCYYLVPPRCGYSSRPGWHYFIRFTAPRTFTDTVHEDELEASHEASNSVL